MILIKKFKKKIPSFRHRSDLNLTDYSYKYIKNFFFKKTKYNLNIIKRRKKIYTKLPNTQTNLINSVNIITKSFIYNFKPFKKFIECQDTFGFNYFIPGLQNLYIGNIIYSKKYLFNSSINTNFIGNSIKLLNLPLNIIFSNVYNNLNNKNSYSKSAGTYCKLKELKKTKKKLFLIELPSTQTTVVSKNTYVYIGKNQNFNINKLIEGKFGFGFKKNKKINVRGVAMNPVDHPNGGRTKTVQPERSPWNWVAKKKK